MLVQVRFYLATSIPLTRSLASQKSISMREKIRKVSTYSFLAFSKFLTGRRGSRQLLDTDGYTYNERKKRTTAEGLSTWRCSKNRSKKCPCVVYFCSSDESLNTGPREHNHPAESLVEEKKTLIASLKRKAADQQLSSTQNILTETLATSTPDLNVNLPSYSWEMCSPCVCTFI